MDAIELTSFRKLCKTVGCKPKDREALLLETMKDEVRAHLDAYKDHTGELLGDTTHAITDRILSATDYWEVMRLLKDFDKRQIASRIAAFARELPIDYEYLRGIAGDLGLAPPDPRNAQSLECFLSSVPQVSLYDMEFNAFVNRESMVKNIPCVCIYEQLLGVLDAAADVLIPPILTYSADGLAEPAPESVCAHRSKEMNFMKLCRACFEMIFCESDQVLVSLSGPVERLSHRSSEGLLRRSIIAAGAKDFVWYHEYGHLVMGHLRFKPSHRLEYRADMFATAMLLFGEQRNLNISFWTNVGAVMLFTILTALEAKDGNRVSKSHPPVTDRLRRFLGIPSPSLKALALRLATVCNPTLDRSWGFTIDLDDL